MNCAKITLIYKSLSDGFVQKTAVQAAFSFTRKITLKNEILSKMLKTFENNLISL